MYKETFILLQHMNDLRHQLADETEIHLFWLLFLLIL